MAFSFSNLETLEKNNRIDALSRKARNRRDRESRAAIEALGRIGTGEAVRALLKLSQSNDIAIWEPADAALSRLENPLAVPALLHALLEEGGKPAPLLKGLGLIATPEALEGLYKALEDPRLAPEALAVLKRRKDPKTVEALEGLLERQLQTQAETGPVKYLLRSNSLCREIISALGGMGSTSALMALHRFLRNHPQAPARLRVLAARELCLQGEAGCQALAGYIGEQLDDPQRVQLLVQCLPQEGLTQALYENLNGKPADALAQALVAALSQMDESRWPDIVDLLERLDRDAARSALLLWFVQSKAASREAGYMLARHGDTNPVLVKRLVDMVHLEDQPVRKKAGDLLHDLYVDKLIGEEGVQLVKALLDEEGRATDYSYIGPEL